MPGQVQRGNQDNSLGRGQTTSSPTPVAQELAGWLERTVVGLRWGEILWISAQKPIKTAVTALTDPARHDRALIPPFLLPSLPQLSTDYLDLAKACDPSQPLFALYPPSSHRNAQIGGSLDELVQLYADEIDRIRPTGPLALGGWSAGAVIDHALAIALLARGREVPLIVAIDGAIPSVDPGPRRWKAKLLLAGHRSVSALAQISALLKVGSPQHAVQGRKLWGDLVTVCQGPLLRLLRKFAPPPVLSLLGARFPGLAALLQRHPATLRISHPIIAPA